MSYLRATLLYILTPERSNSNSIASNIDKDNNCFGIFVLQQRDNYLIYVHIHIYIFNHIHSPLSLDSLT